MEKTDPGQSSKDIGLRGVQRRKKPISAPQVGQTTNWNLKWPCPDNDMKSALKQGALVLTETSPFLRGVAVGQGRGQTSLISFCYFYFSVNIVCPCFVKNV